ncbi:MAG: glycoside hydrolase family 25 protein [Bacillota bacterium]|nr:glycoside hydrolase family 25 protein [Bacillota bacterium]
MQPLRADHCRGIDVSRHQGKIDWPAVRDDGIRFVFIKATEGVDYRDPRVAENSAGAAEVGIPAGLYHFARVHNEPKEEARWFASVASQHETILPHVLDIEDARVSPQKVLAPDDLVEWVLAWLQEAGALTRKPCMIYSGAYFINEHLAPAKDSLSLRSYPLWIAHYGVTAPLQNPIWDRWTVFQYTSKGHVNGIRGPVDLNALDDCLESSSQSHHN